MALEMEDGDYLGAYRRFFTDFVEKMDPDDQLPIKMTGHEVTEDEVVGEIIDMTLQYLNQKYCPPSLQSYIVRLVIEEIKIICRLQPESCGLKPQDNIYAPLKLMQAVTRKVYEICKRYLENSRLALLPPPPSTPLPLATVYAIRNSRRKMEDRHVILHDLNTIFNIKDDSPASYYAVFDGHAGQDAAVYCAAHLHQYLAESVHYPTDLERALRDAFVTTDAYFIQKSKKYTLNSGATAVCAVIINKKLYVAWAGDSQAALVKRGNVNQLVNSHRPERNDERERVEKMGGIVLHFGMWRVNGDLAVSRAIGDAQYKPYVTGEPEIRCVILDGTEDFLIIACDGLWDCVDETTAARLVYHQIYRDPYNLEAVSRCLVEHSKSQGSADNITVIVVFLTPPSQIASRPFYAHPLLTDVHLDNMDPDNRYLSSNANVQYDVNAGFVKQPLNQTNGSNLDEETSPFSYRKPSNGQHENGSVDYDDEDDDDLGPETDVDAVDDAGEVCNLANVSRELFPDKDSRDFAGDEAMDDSPPSPNDNKTRQNELIADTENVGDSEDSDDEWNYYRVDPNKEKDVNKSTELKESAAVADKVSEKVSKSFETFESEKEQQEREKEIDSCSASDEESEKEVHTSSLIDTEISERNFENSKEISEPEIVLKEMDFPLNPNAAEFVPVSTPSGISTRIMDLPIAGSPLKPPSIMDDIRLPSPSEFNEGASHRPHELEEDKDDTATSNGNFLIGEDLGDFTDNKKKLGFGLDESEISSTRAEFGDESTASYLTNDFPKVGGFDGSFTESCGGLDNDPMTMSFGPGRFNPLSQPVDLNAVHDLNDSDLCDLNSSPQDGGNQEAQSPDDHPELFNLVSPESETPKHSDAFPDHENTDLLGSSSPVPQHTECHEFEEKMDDVTSEVAAMNLRNEQLSEERSEAKPESDMFTFENNLQRESCLLMQSDEQMDESPVLQESSQSENVNDFAPEAQFNLQFDEFCKVPTSKPHEFEHQEFLTDDSNQEFKSSVADVQVFSNPLDFNSVLYPTTESIEVCKSQGKVDDEVEEEKIDSHVEDDEDNEPVTSELDPPTGDPFSRSLNPSPDKERHEPKEDEINITVEKPEEEPVKESFQEPVEEIIADVVEEVPVVDVGTSIKPSKSLQEFTGLEKELVPTENGDESIKGEIIIIEKEAEKEIVVIEKDPVTKEVEEEEEPQSQRETIDELSNSLVQVVKEPITESQPLSEPVVEESKESSNAIVTAAVRAATVAATVAVNVAEKPKSARLPSKTATKPPTKSTVKSTPTSPTKAATGPASRNTTGSVAKKMTVPSTRLKSGESAAKTSTVTNKTAPPKSITKPTAPRTTLAPKPKALLTAKSPSATVEKKSPAPTTNGEAKLAVKAPIKSRPPATTTASKPLVKSSNTSARPTTAPTTKPKSTTSSVVPKTIVKSTNSSTGTTSRPKTAPSTLTAPKTRTSATPKSPALDKQIKETANKQISSSRTSATSMATKTNRTTTGSTTTTTTSLTARRSNNTITNKKTPTTNRISAKTTSTAAAKTTNKISSAKVKLQNGVCEPKETIVSAEATTTTATNEDLPKKDSPVDATTDNQLITAD